ncbi:MAG: LapA family protein [Sterolibacterium sp.]|nr:LapA family protein [Sterolibacterium sp.]
MRILIWLVRAVIFVALFGLAIKNSAPVDLRLYFDVAWQVPLSMVVLGCFAAGALLGATAAFATWIRQRREIGQLRRQLSVQPKSGARSTAPD